MKKTFTTLASITATTAMLTTTQAGDIQNAQQTSEKLHEACEFFDTNEDKVACSRAIATEVNRFAVDTKTNLVSRKLSTSWLDKYCFDNVGKHIENIRNINPNTSLTALGEYTGECIVNGLQDATLKAGVMIDGKVIGKDVIFMDLKRLYAINDFRVVAIGKQIPDHSFASDMASELKATSQSFKLRK